MRIELLLVHADGHDHFLHGRVTRAFAETVDRALDLRRSVFHAFHGKCGRHAQIVMAMDGDRHVLDAVHVVHEVFDAATELLGQRIARGVGNVHNRRTVVDGGLDHADEEIVVGTTRILGVELHVFDELLGVAHTMGRTLEAFLFGDAQLVLQMARAHADAGMDAGAFGVLERIRRRIDILLHRAGKRANRSLIARQLCDAANALEIARTRYREARFDNVHVEP